MATDVNSNLFDIFPTGLLVLKTKETKVNSDNNLNFDIHYINDYAKSLLKISSDCGTETIIKNLKKFQRIENLETNSYPRYPTFCDYKLNMLSLLNKTFENNLNKDFTCSEKFISEELLIYVKVKIFKDYKLISLDNLLEEKKSIEKNMMKNIKNQYFITLSHELNNPLNSLVNVFEENDCLNENLTNRSKKRNVVKTNVILIKIFIKNLIVFFNIGSDIHFNNKNDNAFVNLSYLINKIEKKYKSLFYSKRIKIKTLFHNLKDLIVNYDYRYIKLLIQNVYIYFYHLLDKSYSLQFEILQEDSSKSNQVTLMIQSSLDNSELKSYRSQKFDKTFLNEFDIESSVKTVEMIKELIMTISTFLKIEANFDNDDVLILKLNHCETATKTSDEDYSDIPDEFSSRISKNLNSKKLSAVDLVRRQPSSQFIGMRHNLNNVSSRSIPRSEDNKKLENPKFSPYNIPKIGIKQKLSNGNVVKNICTNIPKVQSNNKNLLSLNNKNYSSKNIKSPQNNVEMMNKLKNFSSHDVRKKNIILPNTNEINNSNLSLEVIPESFISRDEFNLNNTFSNGGESSVTSDFTDSDCGEPKIELLTSRTDVLLVDDQSFNLNILTSILRNFNIIPDTCMNGQECLDKVLKKNYKLILMDVMMPVMDGIEASQHIQNLKNEKKLNSVPDIIIISAHNVEEIWDRCRKIEIVKEFLSKPVSKLKIQDIINKYLKG